MKNKKALVLGCGVIGLTSGIRLLEEGYEVEIVAANIPPDTTSNVATAYWYPFRVSPPEKVLPWAALTYDKYMELVKIPDIGLGIFNFVQIFDHKVPDPFWKPVVSNFIRVGKDELPPGYVDGYIAPIARIETPIYMDYLIARFKESGGKITKLDKEVENIEEITVNHKLIINCSGLGSGKLFNDKEVFPIRGQLVKTTNPGLRDCINEEEGPLAVSYIVPHGTYCILGGTADDNDWNLEVDPKTSEEILRKCRELDPRLNEAEILGERVGLRPGRTEVRLELEHFSNDLLIIHNYGHGGAGFTLSWGCAEEVLRFAESVCE
ncbi:MAG: D-amino-acid oxidase [Thermodesulfobacteriota bacterium]|nr:MAG: D-amino-acid oxidase [Thermodesulfobacteriota bacterium]